MNQLDLYHQCWTKLAGSFCEWSSDGQKRSWTTKLVGIHARGQKKAGRWEGAGFGHWSIYMAGLLKPVLVQTKFVRPIRV